MKLEGIVYEISKKSNALGRLEVSEDAVVTFTKYKNQITGRVPVLLWIILKIMMLFKKDKEILRLSKAEISAIDITPGSEGKGNFWGTGLKASILTIKTVTGEEYAFSWTTSEDTTALDEFANALNVAGA